jgi:hypothetical protein
MPAITEPAAVTVEQLGHELARLRRNFEAAIADLEQQLAALSPAETPVAARTVPPAESRELSPETVAIIAAAVTSFLGKKVKIRNARSIDSGTTPWAQQGRAIIQASHNLSR